MPWSPRTAAEIERDAQPIERALAPPPPRGGSGTGVHLIGGNTRARQQATAEAAKPLSAWDANAEYWMAKHEREQAAERAEQEKKQRIAAEDRRRAESHRVAALRDKELQQENGDRIMRNALRQQILAVIRSYDLMGRADELATWTKREHVEGSVEGWRMACEELSKK